MKRTVWLITWEGMGEHPWEFHPFVLAEHQVVAVLPGGTPIETIRLFVDALYDPVGYTTDEQVKQLAGGHRPYSAEGAGGGVRCGHNPWLEARLVQNLRAVGDEHFEWDEILADGTTKATQGVQPGPRSVG